MKKINLLAIDAQDEVCSIGLQIYDYKSDTVYVVSKMITDRRTQAALLIHAIEDLLSQNKVELSDLDALVLSIGPGKFTGLRISASVIQGLAYSLNKGIITINSLLLYAEQFANQKLRTNKSPVFNHNLKPIWVCMKAYNNYYYHAKFILDNNILYRLNSNYPKASDNSSDSLEVQSKDEIIALLKEHNDYFLVGTGWHDLIESAQNPGLDSHIYTEPVDVSNIFKLANIEYEDNHLHSPFDILPVYGVNPYKQIQ